MANGGTLRYGVKFDIDSNELKNLKFELEELKKSLLEIKNQTSQSLTGATLAKDFQEAAEAAKKLENIINSSWNSKLNQLDLSKFGIQLSQSFGSLKNLQSALIKAGDAGVNSFNQLTRSILHTNIELTESSTILNKMAVTMANTVRFGISSSIFNNLTNSVSKAYNYVKDLDKSLNNIRIVSGQSAEQMENFARYANSAAQSLGATTLDYTRASLIYYQQGLSTEDVEARADVTVKMANVLKSSTTDVSNYMTAIWNNFAVGSENLEHFADVITALGASTASSSEEIAQGLSKFAAVSKTIGLSYEYATAALATVVAQTRQSADTVGTAFKTLFSRIEGLSLGDTLEDGTTLNKYSEALRKIGVNIKDSSGNLKTMNTILDEMGEKWKTLSETQKVATAQTVGGVRQYNQLIALMDNWDVFNENLQTASNATGTLSRQQDIYLDSVEAHLNQLTAASEKLYQDIFDEDTIKTFADALTKLLGIVDNLVQGLGGGLNSFVYFGSVLSNVFNVQIANAINRQIVNMERLGASATNVKQKMEAIALVRQSQGKDINSEALELEAQYAERILQLKGYISQAEEQELTIHQEKIGDLKTEIEYLEKHKQIAKDLAISDTERGFKKEQAEEEKRLAEFRASMAKSSEAINRIQDNDANTLDYKIVQDLVNEQAEVQQQLLNVQQSQLDESSALGNTEQVKILSEQIVEGRKLLSDLQGVQARFSQENIDNLEDYQKRYEELEGLILNEQSIINDVSTSEKDRVKLQEQLTAHETERVNIEKQMQDLEDKMVVTLEEEDQIYKMQTYQETTQVETINLIKQGLEGVNAENDKTLQKKREQLEAEKALEEEALRQKERAVEISNVISGVSTLVSSFSSLIGIGKTWFGDNDLSFWEKFSQTITVSAATLPILLNGWDRLKKLLPSSISLLKEWVATQMVKNSLDTEAITKETALTALEGKNALAILKEAAAQVWANIQKAIRNLLDGNWTALGVALVVGITAATVALGAWIAKLIIGQSEEEKFQEKIKAAEEALRSASDAYQELKDKIANYQNAEDGLKNLTRGTVEFYEAVAKANENAQELIDTLGLVAGQDYTIDATSGLLKINEESLNQAQFREQQKVFQAQGYLSQQKYEQAVYRRDKTIDDARKEIGIRGGGFTLSKSELKEILSGTIESRAGKAVDQYGKEYRHYNGNLEYEPALAWLAKSNETTEQELGNITDIVGKFRAEYNKYNQQAIAFESNRIRENVHAYGTQSEVEQYDKMLSNSQALFNTYISGQEKLFESTTKSDWESYWDTSDDGWLGGGLKDLFKQLVRHFSPTLEAAVFESAAPFSDLDVKKLYAQNVLKYDYDDELKSWVDVSGNKIDFSQIKDIDLDMAKAALESGEYFSGFALSSALEQYQGARFTTQNLMRPKDQDAEDLLTEAVFALENSKYQSKTGQTPMDQIDWGVYTEDEIKRLKQYVSMQEELNELTGEEGSIPTGTYDKLVKALENVELGSKRASRELKDYNEEIEKSASELGISTNALKLYDAALQNATKGNIEYKKSLADVAAESYKFNKTYNEGRKTFSDNKDAFKAYTKALKEGKDISYDVADGAAEIIDSLKKMNIQLSNKDLADPKVLKNIEKLFSGTEKEAEKAFSELEKISLTNILEEKFADSFENLKFSINDFVNYLDGLQPGAQLNSTWTKNLYDMVNNAQMTKEEVEQLFANMHIKMPPPEDYEITEGTAVSEGVTTRHTYHGTYPTGKVNDDGTMETRPLDYWWDETVEPVQQKYFKFTNQNVSLKKDTGGKKNFTPASTGSSKKSSGGSSSNKKDKINDEFDRYHQINTQITKVNNSLKKLQSQQNKFTGAKLIENLNKQWQLLNTQVENYNTKLSIANEEQKELYEKLSKRGFKFNADGTIANYMGALQAAEDKYNAKVDQYNKLSSSNKKKWDNNKTLDKAKEEYEETKKIADRYDELVSNFIPGLQQDIQDSLDKQIELNVQKFNLKLTVTLDMNQATRDWNEWKKRIIDGIDEDDIYGNANARLQDFSTYYSENGRGDIQAQTEQVQSILTELREMDENGWSDIYHDDRAQALEELKEKYTALMGSMTDAAQIEKDLYQAVLDEMDAVREKFDEQVESYEFLRDIINHDLKVIQMVYGEDAYGAMSKFYDKQQQTYNEQLDFHRQEMDLWYARMEAAEEGSKEWEKARDNWKDAVENYNQTLEAGLENAKNKFQNVLNDIFQNLNNQVTNGKGLDFVNEEWELVNKNADKYLDTINATYGIRELEKKYLDSINKTDNVKAQQNLKKVMDEQLTNLRQKDKLTQYDLDRANKLYEIEIARMALEDARQNKSQMRLRRDSQGNYSYQYVANQDELQKAQDQVDQLTNSLYNFDKERYNTVLSEVYNIWNEYQQKMAEASLINDPELRAEKQRLIQEQYNQLMMQTEEDYQVSKYNLEESFFKDWTNLNDMSLEDFQNLSDNEKDIIMTEMVPTWKNGVSEMADVFYGENGFAKVTQDSWKAIKDAEKEYDDDLKTLETTAGQTYDAIKDGLDENIPKSEELIKNNNDLITVYDEELTRVENVYEAVGKLIDQYKDAEQAAKDAAEAAYKYENKEYNNQIDEIGDQGNSEPEPEKQPEPTPTPQPEPTPPPVDNTPKTGTGNGIPEVGDDVTVKKSATKFSSKSGGAKMWYKVPGNKFYIKAVSGSEIKIGDPHGPNYTDSGITGWVNKKDLEGYNTGGYTGSWDNSGRLAMLHQKELILNQTDTKNMLNAVSVMRGLTYSLGSSILAKLANASATNYSNTGEGGGILEQDVHIEATFPNVRNAVEIEQALNNLVNVASQRIMEKR